MYYVCHNIEEVFRINTFFPNMKLIRICLLVVLLNSYATCDIPKVFEFCSALLSGRQTSCDRTTCQGLPGKKGIQGRGIPGLKGEKGENENFDSVLVEFEKLKDGFNRILKAMPLENQISYCAMGMKSGKIPDSAISVSSSHSGYNGRYARLDKQKEIGMVYAGWHTRRYTSGEWIQIDLGSSTSVSGLVTQGRPNYDQWTLTFKVSCSKLSSSIHILTENGQEKVFPGNTDRDSKVINMFSSPVTCRFIRIYPITWKLVPVLRLEFLRGDCPDIFTK